MLINSSKCFSISKNLSALIGIDLYWSESRSIKQFWSTLIGIDRHWSTLIGIGHGLRHSGIFPIYHVSTFQFPLSSHRMTVAFVYYGISLNIGDLGGNPYINFCISGGVELPANLLAIWLPQQRHVGRIWAFSASYFSCAVVLFSIAVIPEC